MTAHGYRTVRFDESWPSARARQCGAHDIDDNRTARRGARALVNQTWLRVKSFLSSRHPPTHQFSLLQFLIWVLNEELLLYIYEIARLLVVSQAKQVELERQLERQAQKSAQKRGIQALRK